eukprot:TRINITY_DN528_c0_g2_i2.p1 TRINITY_DN528_c0_g2~~TRINITY_DN528_c0_g2_i2.p1  ORF type:complete len:246 (+),score=44.18 TRINITY_DN528_c0_g2_i2:58-795(+)
MPDEIAHETPIKLKRIIIPRMRGADAATEWHEFIDDLDDAYSYDDNQASSTSPKMSVYSPHPSQKTHNHSIKHKRYAIYAPEPFAASEEIEGLALSPRGLLIQNNSDEPLAPLAEGILSVLRSLRDPQVLEQLSFVAPEGDADAMPDPQQLREMARWIVREVTSTADLEKAAGEAGVFSQLRADPSYPNFVCTVAHEITTSPYLKSLEPDEREAVLRQLLHSHQYGYEDDDDEELNAYDDHLQPW